MPVENDGCDCSQVKGFSLAEKVYFQATLNIVVVLGAVGMLLQGAYLLAIGYLIFVLGGFILLMRYTVCARCPHLLEANDCVFLSASLAKEVVSKDTTGPLKWWERSILCVVPAGTVFGPIYWLMSSPLLLAGFVVAAVGCVLGLYMYLCKKCRTTVCPMNRYRPSA